VLGPDTNLELVQAAIAENVGVGGISEFDFDRIKIPAGGGLAFNVATLEGESAEKFITGVVVLARDARAYWSKTLEESGGNVPPDCHSNDGVAGAGEPGGRCAECPLATFGSSTKLVNGAKVKGRGQACKAIRQLYMLTGSSLMPVVLPLPPTSLKAAKTYMLRLAGQGHPYFAVVTKVGLESAQNSGGVKYSKAKFECVGTLNAEQASKAKAYSEMLKPLVANVPAVASDFTNQEAQG
jgi:hypothetical protein